MKQPYKIKLGLLLFTLGFLGILSLLTMEIPIIEKLKTDMAEVFTPFQFKLLVLLNPTILLIIFTVIGTLAYDKVGFKLPVFEYLTRKSKVSVDYKNILKFGLLGGILSGSLLSFISWIFNSDIPQALKNFTPNLLNRFLYGGITEEIVMRFGLMTLFVWLFHWIFKTKNAMIYWVGILLSSLLFGLGHLPIVNGLVENPSFSLILYIILGNSVGGIIFGWLYWKKGLESAMIAHIITHIIFLITGV